LAADVLAKLPRLRSRWPKEVRLTQKTFFKIYDGNQVVGLTTLDEGSILKLIEVKPQHAIVRVGQSTSPVPVGNTDLVERMGGEKEILEMKDDPPPAPAPAPASPVAPTAPQVERSKS